MQALFVALQQFRWHTGPPAGWREQVSTARRAGPRHNAQRHAGLSRLRSSLRAAAAGRASLPDGKYRLLRERLEVHADVHTASRHRPRPTANWRSRTRPPTWARWPRAPERERSSARSASPGVAQMVRALATLGGGHDRRARAAHCATAWRPTWPAAPTMPAADQGGGYCVFNDIAVAARLMQAEWHRARARSAARRGDRPRRPPGQRHGGDLPATTRPSSRSRCMARATSRSARTRGDLDVELPDGCTGERLPRGARRGSRRALAAPRPSAPGLVFYLAGADPHEHDRLGRLKLSTAGLAERDRACSTRSRERRIPVALSMGGGYGREIEETVAIQAAHDRPGA